MKTLLKITFSILALSPFATAQEGTRVYIAHCQQCHDQNSDSHAPLKEALASRPWEQIVKALETGAMRAQGAQLSPEERRAVARYLGKAGPAVIAPMTGQCPAGAKPTARQGLLGMDGARRAQYAISTGRRPRA